MKPVVGVYGSLKKGYHNHALLRGAERVGGFLLADRRMYSLVGFPAVSTKVFPGSPPIYCEVYRVDADRLRDLDMLEGHPEWYRREKIRLYSVDEWTESIMAWVYLMPLIELDPTSAGEVQPNGSGVVVW